MTIGIGGQPGMLITGLSLTRSITETAPVGFGSAPGMPPNEAQLPIETKAAASDLLVPLPVLGLLLLASLGRIAWILHGAARRLV